MRYELNVHFASTTSVVQWKGTENTFFTGLHKKKKCVYSLVSVVVTIKNSFQNWENMMGKVTVMSSVLKSKVTRQINKIINT